jgi:hypothetical protein
MTDRRNTLPVGPTDSTYNTTYRQYVVGTNFSPTSESRDPILLVTIHHGGRPYYLGYRNTIHTALLPFVFEERHHQSINYIPSWKPQNVDHRNHSLVARVNIIFSNNNDMIYGILSYYSNHIM